MDAEFDILIIGSGAGGGTVASALAPLCAEGARIAVLEWGPHFGDEEFTGRELEMAEKLFFDSGAIGNRDQTLNVACARGYGGSTLAYTGTSIEIPQRSLEHWGIPGLTLADLAPRMQRYKQQNNVHELPDEDINENNQLFAAGCRALGHTVKKFPVNIKGCKGSGMCNMGCPNQAKQGTNRVQLPAAEAQGVQVITNCRVHRITPHAVEAEVVSWPHGRPSSRPLGRCRFGARIVVVAAGAMHSSALLAHSRLPVDLPALGRYFTCHPASDPGGAARPADHQLLRLPQDLLLRRFRGTGRFHPRDLHVFPLHDGQEPGRLRRGAQRHDGGFPPPADDPRAGVG